MIVIKAIIIDDEEHCINRLQKLLIENFTGVINIAGSFLTYNDGLAAIKTLQPELVFIDIHIQDKTGFDLLKQVGNIHFNIIFTTAYDKYAVQAFKFSAIDYLLKPVDADDLKQAIKKLEEKISAVQVAQKFDALFHNLKSLQTASKKICVPHANGITFIDVSDIIRCESEVNYTTLFLKNKQKITAAKTLKEFEEMLADYNFFRVHNSHLINLSCIKNYNRGKGGFVTMADNSQVEVSTRRKEEFLKKIAAM